MNKTVIFAMLVVSLFLFSGCDLLFVDEEIQDIAKSGDYSDCASLDTSEDKNRIERCYSYVGRKQDDPSACAAASGSYRDECYEDVAVDLGREDLCNEISSKYDKRSCFVDIAVDKKSPGICANLEGDEANTCYKDYSIGAGDFDSCALITSEAESDECYMHFAVEDSNQELCAGLNSKKNRDECYYGIALANTNSQFCESIEQESRREECYANVDAKSEEEGSAGDCKYDSDCDPICEGDIMWKMGCDPKTNSCIKTFDTDCSSDAESINGVEFPKTCAKGECVRNQAEIDATIAELEAMKKEISDNVKSLTNYRLEVTQLKLEANHKCLDGLSDATNKFIIESAVKLGSIASSGVSYVKDGSSIVSSTTSIKYVGGKFTTVTKQSYDFTSKFTSDAASYFGDWNDKIVEKMYKLNQAPEDAKPPIEDFIAFWCDYNNYLGEILDATGEQLDQQIEVAKAIQEEIDALS
ncbi:hypothetical protein JXB31_04745 [Candidatus Woesearchaeota archaeon]|nr:hypothetical protein [Candidatus Woesearchaeota archaeon]